MTNTPASPWIIVRRKKGVTRLVAVQHLNGACGEPECQEPVDELAELGYNVRLAIGIAAVLATVCILFLLEWLLA